MTARRMVDAFGDATLDVIANEPEKATEVMKVTQKAVDQAVAHGLLHKNTAARKKSAMAKAVANGVNPALATAPAGRALRRLPCR